MTAFSRLWKRAPIWRACLIGAIATTGMAAFFPTEGLKKALPWLPGSSHSLSFQTAPNPNNDNQTEVLEPDPTIFVHDHISIAGRIVPLPEGNWHPILSARLPPNEALSSQALVRTENGSVSGIIIVTATQEPISADNINYLDAACHDNRNYITLFAPQTDQSEECSFLATALMVDHPISPDPFIKTTFNRLNTLGFPVPSFFITATWGHATLQQGSPNAQFETVQMFMPPLDKTSHQLLAPLSNWANNSLHSYPEASLFMTHAKKWLPLWAHLLQDGFNGHLSTQDLKNSSAGQDPAAPQ
ncbi:hypothetical protein [Swingsia samuiensis]|uniref:Uncharacterized protein n=1 Tax=Swingsia samuiensis TaxID=1293412 RepID=A0A4Y6UJI3_9PROT|nr:hypothetical protein [Swingsia samuiensis]QDH16551.1 hypothetical protein E3D00_02395 [Swingsia samuiensis]